MAFLNAEIVKLIFWHFIKVKFVLQTEEQLNVISNKIYFAFKTCFVSLFNTENIIKLINSTLLDV